jgi:hypothetical protein
MWGQTARNETLAAVFRTGVDGLYVRRRVCGGPGKAKGPACPGFAADLAVLSQDVLTVPTPQIPATTSLLTMVDGEVIFEDAALMSAR